MSTLDQETLLAALISGGVIGGAVGLVDRSMERSKYAIPLGMGLGIYLDYQWKKRRTTEHVEIVKGYFDRLWDAVGEDPGDKLPYDPYWSTLATALVGVATFALSSGGMHASIGRYFVSATLPIPPVMEGEIPLAHVIPEGDVYGNTISALINPITMQIIAAMSDPRNLAKHAGAALASQVINVAIERSGIVQKLSDLAGTEVDMGLVTYAFQRFKRELMDGMTLVRENSMITNESLLLMQNPEGSHSVALAMNTGGRTDVIPVVRMPLENWEQAHREFSTRLNITPASRPPDIPDRPPEMPDRPHTPDEIKRFFPTNLSPIKHAAPETFEANLSLETLEEFTNAGLERSNIDQVLAEQDAIASSLFNSMVHQEVRIEAIEALHTVPAHLAPQQSADFSSSFDSQDDYPDSFRPDGADIPDGWVQLESGMYSNGDETGHGASRMFGANQWDNLIEYIEENI